jgi:hypothetical protein
MKISRNGACGTTLAKVTFVDGSSKSSMSPLKVVSLEAVFSSESGHVSRWEDFMNGNKVNRSAGTTAVECFFDE